MEAQAKAAEDAVLQAARAVVKFHWGTSVSEGYHFERMAAMDALRQAVADVAREGGAPDGVRTHAPQN